MSAGLASWIAHIAFWILLPSGWFLEELGPRSLVVFVALWLAGWFGLPLLHAQGGAMFFSYVALLDVALVFMIFKGDVGAR